MIKTNCLYCKKKFQPIRKGNKFCSSNCGSLYNYYSKKEEINLKKCSICAKEFTPYRFTQMTCSRECSKKQEYINNKNKYIKKAKKNYSKNKDKINAIKREKNKDFWKGNCLNCNKEYKKKSNNSKFCSDKCRKDYDYKNNHSKHLKWKRNEYINNKDKIIKRTTEYQKARRKTDPLYNMIHRIRARTNSIFTVKGITKRNTTLNMLGCSPEKFKLHIESQFTKGMNWENRNLWHLDHIKPLSKAKNETELIELAHYTNLQPLWAKDNLKKSNKVS